MDRLLDSVAPEVKTISLGEAEMREDIWERATSTARSESQPYWCVLEWGFPYPPIWLLGWVEWCEV